jgi:hypothetical protein
MGQILGQSYLAQYISSVEAEKLWASVLRMRVKLIGIKVREAGRGQLLRACWYQKSLGLHLMCNEKPLGNFN